MRTRRRTDRGVEAQHQRLSRPPPEALAQAAAVARVLVGADRVLVEGHSDPDGDVCGSCLALCCALRELGRQVVVYSEQPFPHNFAWLPGGALVETRLDPDARFDATVICDAGDLSRLGPQSPQPPWCGTLCWIDHHRHPSPPGDVNYVDPAAPAVGEQIREILHVMNHPISIDVATCIYASLVSDTGSFRYANTTPRALTLAGEMVACGVNPWQMTERIFESQPRERLLLLSRVLPTLDISPCGRFASITISSADMAAVNAGPELTDGFINFPRSIAGVEVAIQFRQRDGEYKVGFRSRGNVDVSGVAEQLGGGGHANAAGCILAGDLLKVRQQVYLAVRQHLDRQRGRR
ncbi:MAG: bifunctional oligoribonuclease/PAP phosphatase NrnA [Deltaproteobacteria bacterium]|nr:bifunctional oligoribonuclease/PAP phosphatase NrnA [Deltaproteobacteria bacterium]